MYVHLKVKSRCVYTAINHGTCYFIRYSRLKSYDIGNYAAQTLSELLEAAVIHSLPLEFGAQIPRCGRSAAHSAPQPRMKGWGGDTWQRCRSHAPSPPGHAPSCSSLSACVTLSRRESPEAIQAPKIDRFLYFFAFSKAEQLPQTVKQYRMWGNTTACTRSCLVHFGSLWRSLAIPIKSILQRRTTVPTCASHDKWQSM